jgi:hypothetical protein
MVNALAIRDEKNISGQQAIALVPFAGIGVAAYALFQVILGQMGYGGAY